MRAVAFLPLVAACTATSDLTEHVQITDDGDHLTVIAYFSIGEYDDVGLHDVDAVVVTFRAEGHRIACNEHGCRDTIDLATPLMPDEPLDVTVHRGGDKLSSTIMIPARIELVPAPLFVSRAQDLTLTWSPATTDHMVWDSNLCVDGHGAIEPDLTTITIPAGSFEPLDPEHATCSTDLAFTRFREAPAARGFAGGRLNFVTTNVTSFASTP